MKRFFTIALCSTSLIVSAQSSMTIKGQLKGNDVAGKKVLLSRPATRAVAIDSALIAADGSFQLKGALASPEMMLITLKGNNGPLQGNWDPAILFFAENGAIKMQGIYDSLIKEQGFRALFYGELSPSTIVKGSKSHDLFLKYYQPKSKLDKERENAFSKYISYLNPGKGKSKGPIEEGVDITNKITVMDSLRRNFFIKYILENSPNEVLAYIAGQAVKQKSMRVEDIDRLTSRFSSVAKKGPLTQEFLKQAAIARKTAVGTNLVDFTLMDADGKQHKLSSYVGKGRYVLVEFWASWCGPCRADIPHLKEAFNSYHSQGFDIVSVSLDEKQDAWVKAMKDEGISGMWPQLIEPNAFKSELASTYRIDGIPACLLFDPSGKLVTYNMRGSFMDGILIGLYGNHFREVSKTGAMPGANPNAASGRFTLHGTLANAEGKWAYLNYIGSDGAQQKDSALIKDGKITISGQVNEPRQSALVINPASRQPFYIRLFIEPGTIEVKGDLNNAGNSSVSGTPVNDEYIRYNALFEDLNKKLEPLSKEYDRLNLIYIADKRAGKPEAELDKLKEQLEEVRNQMGPFSNKRRERTLQYFREHPQSYITLSDLRYYVGGFTADTTLAFYNRLGSAMQQTDAGKELLKEYEMARSGSPGSMAKNFSGPDINGQPLNLTDFRGKYVLIDFWASWCVPCRKGNPHLLAQYAKYKSKGFEIIGVSDDDSNPAAWKTAVEKDKIGVWKHVLRGLKQTPTGFDRSADKSDLYGIHSLPTKILIDPAGKIIGRYGGGGEDDDAMDRKLAEVFAGK